MSVLLPKGEFCCLRVRVSSDSSDGRTGTRAPPTVSHFNLNFKKLQGRWPHCWADRWSVRGTLKKITDLFTVLQSKKKKCCSNLRHCQVEIRCSVCTEGVEPFSGRIQSVWCHITASVCFRKMFYAFWDGFFGHSDTFFSLWNLREMVTKKRRDGWL